MNSDALISAFYLTLSCEAALSRIVFLQFPFFFPSTLWVVLFCQSEVSNNEIFLAFRHRFIFRAGLRGAGIATAAADARSGSPSRLIKPAECRALTVDSD
jgi:hypothetical protein